MLVTRARSEVKASCSYAGYNIYSADKNFDFYSPSIATRTHIHEASRVCKPFFKTTIGRLHMRTLHGSRLDRGDLQEWTTWLFDRRN